MFRDEFGLIGVPIAEATSKFIKPLRFGDSIEITSYVTSWQRKTFNLVHEVRRNGELCAEGLEIRVCAELLKDGSQGIRAVPIPDEIRQRLSAN